MQKFKHNNTNIWIWKYCLLKIYLDYRELMTTGCWQQRDDSYSKKKITRENFLNSQNFSLSNIFFLLLKLTLSELLNPCRTLYQTLFQLCLMKPFVALFIGEDSDFRWIFNLENYWNSSCERQLEPWWIISAEGKKSLLFSFFPQAPRYLQG